MPNQPTLSTTMMFCSRIFVLWTMFSGPGDGRALQRYPVDLLVATSYNFNPWDLLPNLPCQHSQWPKDTSRDFQGKCGHQRAAQAAASAYCNLCAGSSLWPVKGYYQRLHQALHSLQDHNVSSWNVRIPLGLYIESKQRYGKCFACGHAAFADASFPTHKGCNWADSAHLIFRQ